MQVSATKSNLQRQPSDSVVEIAIADFSRILRTHFGVFSETDKHKPFAVRYTGAPYDQSNEDCKSILVYTHAKGTLLSPLCIFAVLDKFEIPISSYLEAIVGQGKLIRMRPHEG